MYPIATRDALGGDPWRAGGAQRPTARSAKSYLNTIVGILFPPPVATAGERLRISFDEPPSERRLHHHFFHDEVGVVAVRMHRNRS